MALFSFKQKHDCMHCGVMRKTMRLQNKKQTILFCIVYILFLGWCFTSNTYRLNETEVANFFFNLPDPFINAHNYTFILSATICAEETYHVIMLINTKPSSYYRRKIIRETYGSVKQYNGKHLTLAFLLGAVESTGLQRKIVEESQKHGDIIQGNFIDTHDNLTMKHIMAMHWFENNCKADFVLKLEDDTFVNPYRLVEYLSTIPISDTDVIYCRIMSGMPARDPESKWFVPFHLYPFEHFPPYCLGFAYITTPDVWRTLYNASVSQRTMGRDDVFITGILTSVGGVKRKDISDVTYDCHGHGFDVEAFIKSVFVFDKRNECNVKARLDLLHRVIRQL